MTTHQDQRANASEPVLSRRGAMGALGAMAVAGPALAQYGSRNGKNEETLDLRSLMWDDATSEYILPPLPYAYDALEPHIDEETMRIHHDKHHAGYVRGANGALQQLKAIREGQGDASLIKHWERQLAFHTSGHINHSIFWYTMAPSDAGGGGRPSGSLARAMNRDFGSWDQFVAQFKAAAGSVEGSGWGWLLLDPFSKQLRIVQTMNQQNENIRGGVSLVGVDVWEHAYYLRYQNRRADYINAFMNVINWSAVGALYDQAMR